MPVQQSPTSITTRSAAQRQQSNSGHGRSPSSDKGADATMLPTHAPDHHPIPTELREIAFSFLENTEFYDHNNS
ncbi:hypothetical protein PGT21_012222 [Puccinia graminis f. sp. tritici]|uniref:Uncharacterized protein n=1 Tax=Puccinia graminis f. sp. tritici TaxID=56615 RepID=A0A5B0LRF6_PUCGR|nr:hypothetical protein PGTUg99_016508 [Puccinia graminis f. sp. tritici]KAA1083945.1 hypothetical protein PGT21_012222 [Puccinia graminis f. sp. tritici]